MDHVTAGVIIRAIRGLKDLVERDASTAEIRVYLHRWRNDSTVYPILIEEWFKIVEQELF